MLRMKVLLQFALFCFADVVSGYFLKSFVSQNGLHGEFIMSGNATHVEIRTNLNATLQNPEQVWAWSVHQFPVDYRNIHDSRCSDENIGEEVINLTEELGFLFLPDNQSAVFLSYNSLLGKKGFWGKSMLLQDRNGKRICSSIVATDKIHEKYAVAKFSSPISGTVILRWMASENFQSADINIITDLYYTKYTNIDKSHTIHKWKIYATDIFDAQNKNLEKECNVLQTVFDPNNQGENNAVGDLDVRLGLLNIAVKPQVKKFKMLYADDGLTLLPSDMERSKRSLYIVVLDEKHPDSFLACAKIQLFSGRMAKAIISMEGVKGEIKFNQPSPFDPTWVTFNLSASDNSYESKLKFAGQVKNYEIRELPPKLERGFNVCNTTGAVFNPKGTSDNGNVPAGLGTQDQYLIGDILGKLKGRTEYLDHRYILPGLSNELSGLYWDIYLPLENIHSVMHRSFVINRYDNQSSICGIIHQYDADTEFRTEMRNAQILFRYPLVGKIVMRQPLEKPWEDTTVIIEYLIHADGSNVNNTFEHRWAIHDMPPGADFYNWTARCLSAQKVFDPHTLNETVSCDYGLDGLCRVGDLTARHGSLAIAGRKVNAEQLTRRLFTDANIALFGRNSIFKRSIVIYDDHGPVARGERMACSLITSMYRRKAVVRDWFGNGDPNIEPRGRIEFLQQSEYDMTSVQVSLDRLEDVGNYMIHEAPVQFELDFPCEDSTLYDTFNPFNVKKNITFPPEKGTDDQYPVGDLGSKHGLVNGMRSYMKSYNESQVTLFGQNSIIARSVVLHKTTKNHRWACSSIERGYSPSEAREIRAIASFHHPHGFGWGYVRMTQLIYNDGSQSDTAIEVNLRHPGVRDRNMTFGHKWAIYVNPVGVDATVKTATRCVAAGYVWNPYYTQLADPLNRELYEQECGADNPYRCYVGDLSARLRPISMGVERQIFMDSNFPLEGIVTAVGRSIVILGPEGASTPHACANIEPDKDIVKYVNMQKPPRFSVGTFLETVRSVMGVPEWMLNADARKTKTIHEGTCIQLLLHFMGPHANKLELDFARLVASGKLDSPSIYIPGYIDNKRKRGIPYKECGVTDPNEKPKKKNTNYFGLNIGSAGIRLSLNNQWISIVILMRKIM